MKLKPMADNVLLKQFAASSFSFVGGVMYFSCFAKKSTKRRRLKGTFRKGMSPLKSPAPPRQPASKNVPIFAALAGVVPNPMALAGGSKKSPAVRQGGFFFRLLSKESFFCIMQVTK